MFNFFNKKKDSKNSNNQENNLIINTASLLIHAAKMDENYTENEKNIIKKTLLELGCEAQNISSILTIAEKKENDSNQILDFTKNIKNTDDNFKEKLIETLWEIIYSDKNSDMYESNLMRRLSGLLYLDNKLVGDIQLKVKRKLKQK